jgi:hypothetical protein
LRAQPAPRLRRDQRLRLRRPRRRPRRLRHRRFLGAFGYRGGADEPRPPPSVPARRHGRSQRRARAGGAAAALFRRERAAGQLVSTSLLREGLYTLSFDLALALRFGVPLAVADRKTMGNPAINNYQDKDGRWFWIVGLEGDRHWPPLARVAGHPEWIEDPRFATVKDRARNAAALIGLLDEIFA